MIVLIRHGMTDGNEQGRYLGSRDESISERGAAELARLKQSGLYPRVDAVFSSPMKRCMATAGIIYPDKTPVIIQDLREMYFGEFEGLTHAEIIETTGFEDFGKTPESMIFPGGEPLELFRERCTVAFADILKNKSAAVVAHGGVIMSIMHSLFGTDLDSFYSFGVENGRGYRIIQGGELSYDRL